MNHVLIHPLRVDGAIPGPTALLLPAGRSRVPEFPPSLVQKGGQEALLARKETSWMMVYQWGQSFSFTAVS